MIEQGFDTLSSKMRTMMAHTGIHDKLKTGLCPECATNSTKLENIMINPHEEKCAHDKFYNNITDYKKNLKTYGKM